MSSWTVYIFSLDVVILGKKKKNIHVCSMHKSSSIGENTVRAKW